MLRKVKVGAKYRHFKGAHIKILCIATNSETLEKMVVYEDLINHEIWVRPYDMFNSLVDKEKYPEVKQKYRFELIEK